LYIINIWKLIASRLYLNKTVKIHFQKILQNLYHVLFSDFL
jgi:hypothetical protein